jgi:hypothetical protein
MFDSLITIDGGSFVVNVGLDYENAPVRVDAEEAYEHILRKPFHVCCWRADLAKLERFTHVRYGEGWGW